MDDLELILNYIFENKDDFGFSLREDLKFAWLPILMSNNKIIWFNEYILITILKKENNNSYIFRLPIFEHANLKIKLREKHMNIKIKRVNHLKLVKYENN